VKEEHFITQRNVYDI